MLDGQKEPAASCPHSQTARRVISSQFFKHTFEAEADVCEACGVTLWTPDTQQRFKEWILALKHERRDVFQVQFYMSTAAREGLADTLSRFPGVPASGLLRALTTVFLSAHTRIPRFQLISAGLIERASYRLIALGPRRKTSLQFSPMALLELQTWSDVLKLPPHKIVEDAVFKLLALQSEADPELRGLWDRDLRPQMELILRSV